MKQILVGLLSIVLGGIVSAQEDPRTREPNTARPTKGNDPRDSRTTKTKEAAANRPTSFPEAIRNLRKAVFLVGYSGGHGSAWVLSKKHRLLATNAHVADMFHKARKENLAFQAMMNGTKQVYTVTKVWYHPGVRRFPTADENLSVCSTDPAFGDVDPASPDLAVLQLGPDGPDLPVEFELARAAVLYDLQGLPVAILGYPGHDTLSWPKNGGPVQATFHEGVVSRVTDFRFEATDDELAQCLQYTMETFSGFSGSPIFLRTGEIIGLHNSSRTVRAPGGGPARMIANGIRADSLSELLVYHKLDGLVVPPSPPPDKLVRRWAQPDPAMDLYRKLWTLNKEAGELIYGAHDFPAGIQKCNEAIALFKAYTPAYRTRCNAYNNWEFSNSSRLSFEKRRELLLKAYADATAYIDLHRNLTPDALQTRIVVVNNLGFLTKNHKFNEQALDDCEKILTLKNLTAWQRASAISSMAVALSNLDRPNEARQKHEQALQVNPDGDVLWDNRASFFENNDNPAQARYDKAMAASIRKRDLLLNRTQSKDVKIISKVENQLADGDPVDGRGCHVHHWESPSETAICLTGSEVALILVEIEFSQRGLFQNGLIGLALGLARLPAHRSRGNSTPKNSTSNKESDFFVSPFWRMRYGMKRDFKKMFWQKLNGLGTFEGLSGGDPNDPSIPCDPPRPLGAEEIVEIERQVGAALPDDYRKFLTSVGGGGFVGVYAGAKPIEVRGNYAHEVVDIFYGMERDDSVYNLARYIAFFRDRIPAELIPIGRNAYGDQFCLGIKGPTRGKVYLWDHEDERTDEDYWDIFGHNQPVPREWRFANITLVAESFEDFFLRLEDVEKASVK